MKKNVMMRLASFLLVAVLISTSAISGTYAKYVTKGTGSDSARVAKFGVEVIANGDTFATKYDSDEHETVVSAGSVHGYTDVVAPGTKGDMVSMQLTGTPEVDVKVTYTVDKLDLAGWYINGGATYYCPLKITVNNETFYGLNYADEAAFESAVKAKIEGYSSYYEANTDLATQDKFALQISWAWDYEGTDSKQTDANDTALGDLSAQNKAGTIDLTVTTTVTQVD